MFYKNRLDHIEKMITDMYDEMFYSTVDLQLQHRLGDLLDEMSQLLYDIRHRQNKFDEDIKIYKKGE